MIGALLSKFDVSHFLYPRISRTNRRRGEYSLYMLVADRSTICVSAWSPAVCLWSVQTATKYPQTNENRNSRRVSRFTACSLGRSTLCYRPPPRKNRVLDGNSDGVHGFSVSSKYQPLLLEQPLVRRFSWWLADGLRRLCSPQLKFRECANVHHRVNFIHNNLPVLFLLITVLFVKTFALS